MAMASAGASLVQLYTSFGYRGVGTPRLLKDEISAELAGGMWKQAVGRDWAGKEMGWDEKRLEQESEALRKEAEGLGELLRKAWEEDDTARLVKEAQEALSDIKVPSGNLAGAPDVAERHKEAVQGLMEAATQPQMQAIETAPAVSIEAEQLLTIGTAVVPEPVTAPVEIKEIEVTPVLEQEDTWTSAVRSGQRRLV
jgi:dihydroorotate dehydrogenase